MGFIGDILGGVVGSAANAVIQGGPKRQYKWNQKAAQDANQMNRENQQWLLEQQKSIQAEQREYDSPAAQMARLKAAGLNPNLIYGGGTSSVGQAFPMNAPGIAPVHVDAPSARYADLAGGFLSAARGISSIGLTEAKTTESLAKAQATDLQSEISKTNPMLNPKVAYAVSSAMLQTALTKENEMQLWRTGGKGDETYMSTKIRSEVESLSQRLGLNTADLAIKNKILESKEFENAVKEIQVKWLKDGDFSPEHIRQGLMLILSKMLGH